MRHESSEGEICAPLFFAQLRRGCVVTPLQKEDQKIFTPLFCQPSNWPCIRFQQMGWSRNVAWSSPSRRISKTSCISSPLVGSRKIWRLDSRVSELIRQQHHTWLIWIGRWFGGTTTSGLRSQGSRVRHCNWIFRCKINKSLAGLEQEHGVLQHVVGVTVQLEVILDLEPIQEFVQRLYCRAKFSVMLAQPRVQKCNQWLGARRHRERCTCFWWKVRKVNPFKHHQGVAHAGPRIESRLQKQRSAACLEEQLQCCDNCLESPHPRLRLG